MYGSREPTYDPVGDAPASKSVEVDGFCYSVHFWAVKDVANYSYRAMFHHVAQIVVLTYDFSSRESFQNLGTISQQIPRPLDGRIQISKNSNRVHDVFVTADEYPVVVVGCKCPVNDRREVQEEDVHGLIKRHPGWLFAGECEPTFGGQNLNVEEVVYAIVERYHRVRTQAIRETGVVEIPPYIDHWVTPGQQLQASNRKKSGLCVMC